MGGLRFLFWIHYALCGFIVAGFVAFGVGAILLAIGCFADIGAWGQYGLWLMAGGAVPILVWIYIRVKGAGE